MIFLHEGLGAISLWRDFPQRVAGATGCEAVVYSRAGYGRSTPADAPRQADYMDREGHDGNGQASRLMLTDYARDPGN